MDDIKNMIAAADSNANSGKKSSNASLAELFRALRKSKVCKPKNFRLTVLF